MALRAIDEYDRDDHFDRFFAPAAAVVRHQVAGKWTRTDAWPHVELTGRAALDHVAGLHRKALATVLLLPQRYCRVEHMTSRWWETLLAGCIPLVPIEIRGADFRLPRMLRVTNGQDVIDRLAWLRGLAGSNRHADLLAACLARLEPFRCSTIARETLAILEDLS